MQESEKYVCHGMDTQYTVNFYEHEFYPLSNFSSFQLDIWGVKFYTSEVAYQYARFEYGPMESTKLRRLLANEVQQALIDAASSHEAYRIAQEYKSLQRPDWNEIKVETMRTILQQKVKQHPYVKQKLLETGDRQLVENSWRDGFWGHGEDGEGRNMLGDLWMQIRAEIQYGG